MTVPKILVSGATGRTGRHAIEYLKSAGIGVRALVHHEGPKADALRALGTDVVIGDLLKLDDVAGALDGIESAYFCYPIAPRLIDATSFFAVAAKEAGVKAIVNMSQISARRHATSNAAQEHWVSERILDWTGIATTHLRPTFFAEWLTVMVNPEDIKTRNAIRLPMGEGRHAPIASEDQGRLIAAILQNPLPHAGKTYTLHGPIEMSHHEIAAAIGRALGRELHYEPITFEEFATSRLQQIGSNPHVVQHLSEVTQDYQNKIFEGADGVIGAITGQPPMSVETFIEKNRSYFA
ncbi:NmrA family transcriptional regulator [Sphingobium yanoikuyae]|uniref:NmrA family transcriptional regulator n=1 Tax=Sphingobium yanoikuyae TaxID=13690 RepID=A0A177JXB4_SPHYA|nr:NmrA family NAD(P)-binding protein [Sphingobium yanoikuyae]OAH45466.1 NmrA family transcriptional regulator [Sphingobium yanoikuyae]